MWESEGNYFQQCPLEGENALSLVSKRRAGSKRDEQIIHTNVGESRAHGNSCKRTSRCSSR